MFGTPRANGAQPADPESRPRPTIPGSVTLDPHRLVVRTRRDVDGYWTNTEATQNDHQFSRFTSTYMRLRHYIWQAESHVVRIHTGQQRDRHGSRVRILRFCILDRLSFRRKTSPGDHVGSMTARPVNTDAQYGYTNGSNLSTIHAIQSPMDQQASTSDSVGGLKPTATFAHRSTSVR